MANRIVGTLRKIGVLLVGIPILIVGIILIPLPGPGVLVCLLALFILSLEFRWAEKYRDKAVKIIKDLFQNAKARSDRIAEKGNDTSNK